MQQMLQSKFHSEQFVSEGYQEVEQFVSEGYQEDDLWQHEYYECDLDLMG